MGGNRSGKVPWAYSSARPLTQRYSFHRIWLSAEYFTLEGSAVLNSARTTYRWTCKYSKLQAQLTTKITNLLTRGTNAKMCLFNVTDGEARRRFQGTLFANVWKITECCCICNSRIGKTGSCGGRSSVFWVARHSKTRYKCTIADQISRVIRILLG